MYFQIRSLVHIKLQQKKTKMKFLVVLGTLVALSATANGEGVKAGEFTNYAHGISGSVYAIDEKTLLIKGFTYDGAGPDAFFWAGTQGSPSRVGTILPYPFEGKFFEYEDQSAPILSGQYSGDTDIKLTLPDTLKATDIKWLSVWCRAFGVNFGDMSFPVDFSLHEDEAEAEVEPEPAHPKEPELPEVPRNSQKPTELPPPVLAPVDNDLSNVHNHPRHDQDADAYPESEPESEPESRPYNGSDLISCTNIMVLIAAILSAMVL